MGGIALAVLAAAVMVRPTYRLPALLAAILAIPGNVDNLLPQMQLDPHSLANNTAPAISVVDLLILWALLLTLREDQLRWPASAAQRWTVGLAVAVAAVATLSSLTALASGVEPTAVLRGILVFARIAALLLLGLCLREALGDGRRLAMGAVVGVIALLGNGFYTSAVAEAERFTASTIGRNGFGLALVLAGTLAGGLALACVHTRERRWLVVGAAALAAAAFFGSVATGTRMSLLALIPALVVGLALSRFWTDRRRIVPVITAIAILVVTLGAAGVWTAGGGRAISAVTDFGDTVDIITDPESEPDYSPVRSRTRFWANALTMIRDHPLAGVGPYQWNIVRYDIDPEAIEVVADPHNAYLQVAAEFGLPTLALYGALVAIMVLQILIGAWRSPGPLPFVAVALLVAALIYPVAELTNSHLFNVRMGAVGWLVLASALTVVAGRPASMSASSGARSVA